MTIKFVFSALIVGAVVMFGADGCRSPAPSAEQRREAAAPAAIAPDTTDAGDGGRPVAATVHRQVIENTELRVLPTSANGRDYLLYIALPPSFKDQPARRYPVLYVCDGYWDFNLINGLSGNLLYDGVIPEYILVGFGYPDHTTGDEGAPKTRTPPDYEHLRRWDYTPTVDPHAHNPEEWGHAADFLAVVEREIIPFVESNYRGDPTYRVLGGSSLGGLFVLYALFARPGLFAGYIAPSPAVALGDDWLFKFEQTFANGGGDLKARLFMSGAEREEPRFLADVKRFNAQLVKHRYRQLTYQFRIVDGERHTGTKPESYNRGMRFAFLPRAPRP